MGNIITSQSVAYVTIHLGGGGGALVISKIVKLTVSCKIIAELSSLVDN